MKVCGPHRRAIRRRRAGQAIHRSLEPGPIIADTGVKIRGETPTAEEFVRLLPFQFIWDSGGDPQWHLVKGLETVFSLVEATCLLSMRPGNPKLHNRSGINVDVMVRVDLGVAPPGLFL